MELDKNFDMHLSFFRVILFLLKNRFSSLVRLKNFQNRFGCYLINDDILHLAVLSALLLDFLMQLLINLIRTNLVQTRIRLWGHLTRWVLTILGDEKWKYLPCLWEAALGYKKSKSVFHVFEKHSLKWEKLKYSPCFREAFLEMRKAKLFTMFLRSSTTLSSLPRTSPRAPINFC